MMVRQVRENGVSIGENAMRAQDVSNAAVLVESGNFVVGCNYWASHAGMLMWRDWRPEVVEEDLRQLAEQGVQVMRVFPLWPDFQPLTRTLGGGGHTVDLRFGEEPLPQTGAGRAGVAEEMMARFRWFADAAALRGIKLLVGLVTGWMSGRLFVPPAFEGKNVLADPECLMWQVRFVRYFVRYMRGHHAICGWDLGNECNCMAPVSREQAWGWTNAIAGAIRAEDRALPVVSGMHSLLPQDGAWRIQDQGELTDLLTTHPYPLFTPYCNQEPVNRMRNTLHATAESRLYADIAGRPCMAEEVGTLGPTIGSEEVAAAYARTVLFSLWAQDCHGLLWWCAYDQDRLQNAPYDSNALERELGLIRSDRTPKPVLREIGAFARLLRELPFERLPERKAEAVCLLTPGQDCWAAGFSAFLLARQAGFDLQFRFAGQALPDAALYLLPSLSGANHTSKSLWRELRERAEAGATVYVSQHDAMFSPFKDFFGMEVRARELCTADMTCILSGHALRGRPGFRLLLEACGAEVLAAEADGNPVFTRHAMGKGAAYFLAFPLEQNLAQRPGAFDEGAEDSWRIYAEVGRAVLAERIVRRSDPLIGVSEHPTEGGALAVLVNHATRPRKLELTLAPGWTVREALHHAEAWRTGIIPANDGMVLRLVRG